MLDKRLSAINKLDNGADTFAPRLSSRFPRETSEISVGFRGNVSSLSHERLFDERGGGGCYEYSENGKSFKLTRTQRIFRLPSIMLSKVDGIKASSSKGRGRSRALIA